MTLEQLMAFTITDDHARQQEVREGLHWEKGPETIRRTLTEGQVAASDRWAQLVDADEPEISAKASGGLRSWAWSMMSLSQSPKTRK